MLRTWQLALIPCSFLALIACGDSGGTGGNTSTGSGPTQPVTSSGTGGQGPTNSGDCDTSADCPPNGNCVAIIGNGFRSCQFPAVEVTMCDGQGGAGGAGGGGQGGAPPSLDECCETDDCNNDGICVKTPVFAECGGAPQQPHNVCTDDADECNTAADCNGGLCAPRGVFGNKARKCYPLRCAVDGDCNAKVGGICAPVTEPCCGNMAGLYCVYPGQCRKNADCGGGQYCEVTADVPTCKTGTPTCPQ